MLETVKEVKERARFILLNKSFLAYLTGHQRPNSKASSKDRLEEINKVKGFMFRLSDSNSGYFDLQQGAILPHQLILQERALFYNKLAQYLLICFVVILSLSLQLSATEIYEIKQGVVDSLGFNQTVEDRVLLLLPPKVCQSLHTIEVHLFEPDLQGIHDQPRSAAFREGQSRQSRFQCFV